MTRTLTLLATLVALAAPLAAQSAPAAPAFWSGLKIRGSHVYNRSSLDTEQRTLTGDKQGWSAGLEIVGEHIGLGLSGFTAGNVSEFQADSTAFVVLAEANYHLPIRPLRLAPYVGIHSGLGTYTRSFFDAPKLPRPQDTKYGDVGYQMGVRFYPISLGSVDLQYRKLSRSAAASQDPGFEQTQLLLGVTLF